MQFSFSLIVKFLTFIESHGIITAQIYRDTRLCMNYEIVCDIGTSNLSCFFVKSKIYFIS